MKLKLTRAGQALLTKAINKEDTIDFLKLKLGKGVGWPENIDEAAAEATDLIDPVLTVDINSSNVMKSESAEGDDFVNLIFTFDNGGLAEGFHVTELGIVVMDSSANEILYALGIENEATSDYIPGETERVLEFELETHIFVGDSENVNIVLNESLTKVSWADFRKHVENYENPHKTTKFHVGLSEVPNVSTNNQVPTFSETEALVNIESGERLTVLFGKIKKAISELIYHLRNTNNPHKVSPEGIGAADEMHTHSTNDLKSGVLSVVRGGTGKGSHEKNAVLIGNDKETIGSVKGTGALFSTGGVVEAPKFGVLPVQFGGTGLAEGASFFYDNDYGCFGSVVLPGGLLVQWGRLKVDAVDFGEWSSHNTTVKFQVPFADTKYALLFTTNNSMMTGQGAFEGTGTLANWRMPIKEVDKFTLGRETGVLNFTSRYADWVAFGRAAE